MDRRRTDAEGPRRDGRIRRLALVVLQNLLVAACLLFTLFVYWHSPRDVEEPDFEDRLPVHIQFMTIANTASNGTLKFGNIRSSYRMSLVGRSGDRIYVNCTGPYVLYMDVCYKSLRGHETRGSLQLQVERSKTPASIFNLTASQEVCSGLQSTVYLRATEQASLYLYVMDGFKVKNVTVGLSCLLGRRCDF